MVGNQRVDSVEKTIRFVEFTEDVGGPQSKSLFAVFRVDAVAENDRFATRMDLVEITQNIKSVAALQSDIEYGHIRADAIYADYRVLRRIKLAA